MSDHEDDRPPPRFININGAHYRASFIANGSIVPHPDRLSGGAALDAWLADRPCLALDAEGHRVARRDAGGTSDRTYQERQERRQRRR